MKVLTLFLAAVLALGAFDAEAARRLGGGGSIGRQSSTVTQRQASPAPASPTNAAPSNASTPSTAPGAGAATPARRPWAGMLGGLAAGLGLAWLAHSLGFGEAFGSVLMVLLVVLGGMALLAWFMRGRQPQPAYAGAGAPAADQARELPQYSP